MTRIDAINARLFGNGQRGNSIETPDDLDESALNNSIYEFSTKKERKNHIFIHSQFEKIKEQADMMQTQIYKFKMRMNRNSACPSP